jgi:TatD DNase family protein
MNQHAATPRLYDAHNHLQDERFADRQDTLVADAREVGVVRMVVNGTNPKDWPRVADLARRFPDFVIPSFGLHPWWVPGREEDWEKKLRAFLDTPEAAVGEIGLDRWKSDLPWAGQEDCFIRQLNEAAARNRPASIHCLQAWGRLLELLEQNPRPACGFILHSYGGAAELVDRLASLGAYFSMPGDFAHERRTRQREAFRHVPPDRLLIETDAPDQGLPADRQTRDTLDAATGKPLNHPANLDAVYAFAAELFCEDRAQLASRVEANFRRLFSLV